jgi:hypothetical protein
MLNLLRDRAVWVVSGMLVLGFLAFSSPAQAATPKADVSFGYSRLGNNVFSSGAGSLNGWEGALNVKVKPFLGIEGDVAQYGMGSASTTPHTTVVMGGPRVTVGTLGFHVFVHALAGVDHSSNSTGFSQTDLAVGLGGGGDVRIFPFFAIRASADYLTTPTATNAGSAHERVSAGLVFRF